MTPHNCIVWHFRKQHTSSENIHLILCLLFALKYDYSTERFNVWTMWIPALNWYGHTHDSFVGITRELQNKCAIKRSCNFSNELVLWVEHQSIRISPLKIVELNEDKAFKVTMQLQITILWMKLESIFCNHEYKLRPMKIMDNIARVQ